MTKYSLVMTPTPCIIIIIIIIIIITWFKHTLIHSKWRIASVEESRVTAGRHDYIEHI